MFLYRDSVEKHCLDKDKTLFSLTVSHSFLNNKNSNLSGSLEFYSYEFGKVKLLYIKAALSFFVFLPPPWSKIANAALSFVWHNSSLSFKKCMFLSKCTKQETNQLRYEKYLDETLLNESGNLI